MHRVITDFTKFHSQGTHHLACSLNNSMCQVVTLMTQAPERKLRVSSEWP